MIQGEKIQALLDAAGVTVEPFWPGMFAKALEGRNIGDLLCSVGTPPGGGGGVRGAGEADAGGGDAQAKEAVEKKEEMEEESEESDEEGIFSCRFDFLGTGVRRWISLTLKFKAHFPTSRSCL